jgi:branched-chain amino acid transport system permease protein
VAWIVASVIGLTICLLMPIWANGYIIRLVTTIFIFAALGQAWNIIGGYTGYAAFGNVVFFGGGAYATAAVMSRGGPFLSGLVLAAIICVVFAVLIGWAVLRLRGHYFAIATLGVAEATREIVINTPFLGAAQGISLPIQRNALLFYFLLLGIVVALAAATWAIERTRPGFAFVSIRENEQAADALGIHVLCYKILAFALSAGITGVVGGIDAYWSTFVDPESFFSVGVSVQIILVCLLGGAGTIAGPILGATLYILATGYLVAHVQYGHDALLGLLIALVVLFIPRGLLSLRHLGTPKSGDLAQATAV